MSAFASMGLYRNVDRVFADLEAIGIGPHDELQVDDLSAFDQYHYEGTDAVDSAALALGAGSQSHILDVGAGLGGPARHLADRTSARVTALEIQPDLHTTGEALTARVGLEHLVEHRLGDILAGDAGDRKYDGIMSMLCVLHIADRATLFGRCAAALEPGGTICLDDYVALAALTEQERERLATTVACPYLPTADRYVADLSEAGFGSIQVIDKTADWAAFVADRLERFRVARPDLTDRYGRSTVAALDEFYTTVAELFAAGRVGGLRLVAQLHGDTSSA